MVYGWHMHQTCITISIRALSRRRCNVRGCISTLHLDHELRLAGDGALTLILTLTLTLTLILTLTLTLNPNPNPITLTLTLTLTQATAAIQRAFPKAYLYDPTPVGAALWRIARHTPAVSRREDGRYVFVQP